jgi:hypothetical protein
MTRPAKPADIFSCASDGAETARLAPETAQTRSPSYRLAYMDKDFMLLDELRPVRLQLELLKPDLVQPNPYITPELSFQFHYFAIRKMHFLKRARALVACAGGFGTLDELFETLTLIQTRKIKPLPVLLLGKAYWCRLINFEALVEKGMIDEQDLSLF